MQIITSTQASDIVEIFRPSRFDGHVQAYREAKWLEAMTADHAARRAAVQAETDKIVAVAQARYGVSADTRQRLAVSALIGECEAIAASGALTEPAEMSLRLLIAENLSAFRMPSKADRAREDA